MATQYLQQTGPERETPAHDAVRRTLLDNDQVLVVSTTYPPGTSVPMHTHRSPSLVYVVEGGSLEAIVPGGRKEAYKVEAGETLWSSTPHAHAARNSGSTLIRIVEIEIKQPAPPATLSGQTPRAFVATSLEWVADTLDPRRAAALLFGDPTRPGPFTVRYRLPAGYGLGSHVHPDEDEQLTVITGAIRWSAGDAGNGAPEYVLKSGAFAIAPAGTPHRIVAVEDSVLQLSGIGPRKYVYVNAADDPRILR